MKNKIQSLLLFLIVVSFAACTKNNGMTYDGDNYINFVKEYSTDSTLHSFAFDTKSEKASVPLEVEIASTIENHGREFKIRFLPAESSAKEGIHFKAINETFTFRGGYSVDTVYIEINKTADLKTNEVCAVFEIIDNGYFKPGILSKVKARVFMTDKLSRPGWWDSWHEENGLGIYSEKKFRLFIEQTGISNLDYNNLEDMTYSDMRAYVLRFKSYVLENKIKEENGNPMIIPIRG